MGIHALFVLLSIFSVFSARAEGEKIGKEAAQKFFKKDMADEAATAATSTADVSRDHYLALHFGTYTSSRAYKWGGDIPEDGIGKLNLGVTYRLGEWTSLMDLIARVDFHTYEPRGTKARKLSVMPGIIFPEANSKFPLYFGASAGIGIFFEQMPDESSVSLDYQLLVGVRIFDLVERIGFLLESGMKNHLLLLSDGQFNGVFVSLGALFTF